MAKATAGNTVRFHYVGKLDDGVQFDTSTGRAPVEVELGAGKTLPAIENTLIGMEVGETRSVDVEAAAAFGQHDPALVHKVERERLPDEVPIEPGSRLRAASPDGQEVMLTIVDVAETEVTLDANHPLAGRDVVFELELVEIV
jgi:peptidylprolyl isomerase